MEFLSLTSLKSSRVITLIKHKLANGSKSKDSNITQSVDSKRKKSFQESSSKEKGRTIRKFKNCFSFLILKMWTLTGCRRKEENFPDTSLNIHILPNVRSTFKDTLLFLVT